MTTKTPKNTAAASEAIRQALDAKLKSDPVFAAVAKMMFNSETSFVPPPPSKPQAGPISETLAMRSIVTALVALLAESQKANGGDRAQVWINKLAVICQELILEADITGNGPNFDTEKFRAKAIQDVVDILAGASVNDDGGNVN